MQRVYAQVKEVFVGLVIQDETLWIEILDQGAGFDLLTERENQPRGWVECVRGPVWLADIW